MNPSLCECYCIGKRNHDDDLSSSPLKESSTITVQLFHVKPPSKEVLKGTAVIVGKDILHVGRNAIGALHV